MPHAPSNAPSGAISPFTGIGTPKVHPTSPRITPMMSTPSINVQPAAVLDILGVTNAPPPDVGDGAVNPINAPLSSISVPSGQSATGVPSNLAERVTEEMDKPAKGPGGGPGSAFSGGGPPRGSAGTPTQPLRVMDTHVDPSS
jgi:hypothetical protein